MNRSYQNMVARYNVYFNGNLKLEEARQSLEKSHVDDFTKVLDVFPYGTESNRKNLTGQMDEVIKKASRIISERPVSRWIDDAYFLMGKAYFFKGDYFAAIETFQFLNSQYKGSLISYDATLWIVKSYVMLGKEREAEAIIGLLNNDGKFPKKLSRQLNEVSAFVYIKEDKFKAASENLEKAIGLAKGSAQKARYHYILGQLYDKQGNRKLAREQYQIVTKGTPPYEMAFNAKINLAKNYNPDSKSEIRSAKRYLKSMLRDDKNITYYGQIYYELGLIEKKEGDIKLAIEYFTLSNQNNTGSVDHKALSYLALADIYFKQPNYRYAQLYYDSAVFFLKPEFKDYELLKAKQEVLSDLIKNLILIQREDSLLKVATLSPKEIEQLVDKAIKDEERRREEEKKKREEQKVITPSNPLVPVLPGAQPGGGSPGSGFYFNDPIQVARGFNEFTSRYGRRENVDNWQFASLANKALTEAIEEEKEGFKEEKKPDEKEKTTPLDSIGIVRQRYTKDIPFTPEAKEASRQRIAEAYLAIGEIYFEQLKDNLESEKALTRFLKDYPKHPDVPKALFYLFKIKSANNLTDQANTYKARLITEFPDSPFTKYLTQSGGTDQLESSTLNKEMVAAYQTAYDAFLAGNYRKVIQDKIGFDKKYYGTIIQPKFDLMEAFAFAHLDSINKSIQLLESLIANYPTSPEALAAQQALNAHKRIKDKTNLDNTTKVPYTYKPADKHYFIALVPAKKAVSMNQIKARFSDFNTKQLPDISFTLDEMLVGDRQMLLIKEFVNREKADAYRNLVLSNVDFIKSIAVPGIEFMVADSKNFGLMIVNSDLEGLLKFTSTYYQY